MCPCLSFHQRHNPMRSVISSNKYFFSYSVIFFGLYIKIWLNISISQEMFCCISFCHYNTNSTLICFVLYELKTLIMFCPIERFSIFLREKEEMNKNESIMISCLIMYMHKCIYKFHLFYIATYTHPWHMFEFDKINAELYYFI
jgi:hypothetical protein